MRFLFLAVQILVLLLQHVECKPDYCLPSEDCWPTASEINVFASSINGEFVTSSLNSTEYNIYVNMTDNLLYRNQYPSFFVICSDVSDIQQSILFAKSHNIQISICSTGHSWSGVSTANYSLQINLSKLKSYKLSEQATTITVETGLPWGDIYKIADDADHKIVIGGADGSVGPGGYSLGGGHSPISPAFGLSSDFITELFMVDANANIVHVYNTSGVNKTIDDLYWASRGGGGGTFGVVVNITFSLHDPVKDSVFTVLQCIYSFYEYPIIRDHNILGSMLNNFFSLIVDDKLDKNFGGYLMVPVSNEEQNVLEINLIYYGNSSFAEMNSEPVLHLNEPYNNSENHECQYMYFDTFVEFQQLIPPFTNGVANALVFNDLVPKQNLSQELAQIMVNFFNSSTILNGFIRAMTSVLIGGAVSERDDDFTSVHPAFRNSAMELGFSFYWSDDENNDNVIKHSNEWQKKFWRFGYGGGQGASYSNEQDYECDNCDWKEMFWGKDHYNKLLKIKQKWDPNQTFWCHHCVGDDSA